MTDHDQHSPGLHINTFLKKISLISGSYFLRFLFQLVIIIVYARQLSVEDYAFYQSVWLYVNFFSVICLFGLPNLLLSSSAGSVFRWIKANSKLNAIFLITLNVSAACWILFWKNSFTEQQKLLIFILLIVQNISLIEESIAIKSGQEKKLLLSTICYLPVYAFAHFYVLYSGYSLTLLLVGMIAAFVIKCLILIPGKSAYGTNDYQNGDLKKQWFYLGINDVLGITVKWLDKWVVLFLLSPALFAVYFNGTYEITVFTMLLSAAGNIMLSEFSKKNGTAGHHIKTLFARSSLLIAAVIFPAFWLLEWYAADLFHFFFADKYDLSVSIFRISILILPVRIIYSTAVLQVYHKSALIVKGAIIDLILALLLAAVLYPFFCMQGLALAFVIPTYVQVSWYLYQTSKITGIAMDGILPFSKLLLLLITSGGTVWMTYFFSTNIDAAFRLLIGMIIVAILVIGLLLILYRSFIKADKTL